MASIKNISVKLEVGKKEYYFKNLILDKLLNLYATTLIDSYKQHKGPSFCALKFSKLENISSDAELYNRDFDVGLLNSVNETTASTNKITNKYVCASEDQYIIDYTKGTAENVKIDTYAGEKIYCIGFSYLFAGYAPILAVLDVSNYDIYIEEDCEIRITRIDEISTDATFTSLSEYVDAPIHLFPKGITGILPKQTLVSQDGSATITIHQNSYAKLSSYGFGNSPNVMKVEKEIENYSVDDNCLSIKNIWSPKGIFPSGDLYASDELYLDDPPFEYIILKFKLLQDVAEGTYESYELVEKETGAEYLQAIPLNNLGDVNLNIKYERG